MTVEESKMDDVEYLKFSKDFLEREVTNSLKMVRESKDDLQNIQEMVNKTKDSDLKKDLMDKFNKLTIDKRMSLNRIKAAKVDIKHVNSILRKLKRYERDYK